MISIYIHVKEEKKLDPCLIYSVCIYIYKERNNYDYYLYIGPYYIIFFYILKFKLINILN
jgi:hypothetical protein